MFCPECQSEYRPEFTHCPACDVDLVPELQAVPENPPEGPLFHADPVVVYATLNSMDANLMKSVLEGSGIEVQLLDESLSRMDSPAAIMIGGIKLIVPADQAEFARAVLEETQEENASL